MTDPLPLPRFALPRAGRRALRRVETWLRDSGAQTSGSAASVHPGATESADRPLAADPALAAVLEGFAQPDQAARAARTLQDALRREAEAQPFADYAGLAQHLRGTANPWGRLWLLAAGVENPRAAALADGLCTGLALTGLLADAPADARAGRLRLPLDELARFGVSPEDLARGAPGPGWVPLLLLQTSARGACCRPARRSRGSCAGARASPCATPSFARRRCCASCIGRAARPSGARCASDPRTGRIWHGALLSPGSRS